MSEFKKYIKELPGYKISDTHFRLGSKIHISHFYYAKRFFQNSFFASRFAFLIAKEILETHKDKKEEFKTNGLTLIGYGLYSELLLSLVEKFLKKALSLEKEVDKEKEEERDKDKEKEEEKINHDLISDVDKPSFIKNYVDTHKYIVIIVPIASTFLTAIKIQDFLTDKLKDKDILILEPYINVLHVSHYPSNKDGLPHKNNIIFPIEKKFGWEKKEDKTIYIKENSSGKEKKQKYLLSLESEWHDPIDCNLCFPKEKNDDFKKERPLYHTDKTSVTPTLIFGKPTARNINGDKNKFDLPPETLLYGHLKRGIKHFHYYIRIEKFFQKNIKKIEDWLDTLKKKDFFIETFNETSRVIIIAPGHYSNTGFINLVNEKLFAYSANIIHFDTQNDHVLNFGLLYGKELQEEDTKVVFVDDTITTGGTFRKINFFVENNVNHKPAFNACIILLDRSNRNVHRQVKVKVKADMYFSFANLYLPSLKDFEGECPLDIGYNRYNELANNSFLTRMKIHFLAQRDKLQERTIDSCRNQNKKSGHNDEERYVLYVEAVHRIYEWCSKDNNNFDTTFGEWRKSLFENTESPFSKEKLNKDSNDKDRLSKETAALLKVLSHSPFIHYKPIKDNLFRWVLELLISKIEKIKEKIKNGNLEYESFRDLKFLLRRAGILNTNYIISEEIFEFIKLLYEENGLSKISSEIARQIKGITESDDKRTEGSQKGKLFSQENQKSKEKLESKLENILDFHVFYTAQIKELLYLNEARSICLERTLNELKNGENLAVSYKQFIRYIQEENGILILKFWYFIKNKLIKIDYNQLIEEGKKGKITKILESEDVKEHYRAKILNEFLKLQNNGVDSLHENKPLINFLKLMHFFKIEQKEKKLSLNDKTDFIIDGLKEFIKPYSKDQKIGAFFWVDYKKDTPPFLAYNSGYSGCLNKDNLKQYDYFKNFFKSEFNDKLTKTIIEFRKEGDKWIDLYSTKVDNKNKYDFNFIPNEYNRLLLIRFNKLDVHKDDGSKAFKERLTNEGLAIAGFYFDTNSHEITDIAITRYLLLLRAPIRAFIERHHKNDEFRDWVVADNIRKLTLLAGHGREMLLAIAAKTEKKGISYKDIILNMEHIQNIVAFRNNIDILTNIPDIKERFSKFYHVKGSAEISCEYFERLGEMAKQIYEFEEIENPVPCKIKVCCDKNLLFAFHKALLDMMCFELFINAKKNRWHFLPEEKGLEAYEDKFFSKPENGVCKSYDTHDSENSRCNYLKVYARHESQKGKNKLIIEIFNTGPSAQDAIKILNRNDNPKETISGLKLIQELLTQEAFGRLGKIEFEEEALDKKLGLSKFMVKLTLNEMNDV